MEGPRGLLPRQSCARWLSGQVAKLGASCSEPPAKVCPTAALRGPSKAEAGWHRGGSWAVEPAAACRSVGAAARRLAVTGRARLQACGAPERRPGGQA